MFKLTIAVLLVTASLAQAGTKCGIGLNVTSNDRIVGGRVAHPHEFPWTVFIQSEYFPEDSSDSRRMYGDCDGSIIDSQWIVTAAHCFGPQEGFKLGQVLVALGAHDISSKTEQRTTLQAKEVLRHSLYDDSYAGSKHDIAMVLLPRKIDFADSEKHITPICLPHDGESVNKNKCQVVGWGKTKTNGQQSSVLKVVDQTLYTATECQKYRQEVSDLQVCAGFKNEGTCQGDSGGPLECKNSAGQNVLQGIVSYGTQICGDSIPVVFTNVEKFIPWINEVRQKYGSD